MSSHRPFTLPLDYPVVGKLVVLSGIVVPLNGDREVIRKGFRIAGGVLRSMGRLSGYQTAFSIKLQPPSRR